MSEASGTTRESCKSWFLSNLLSLTICIVQISLQVLVILSNLLSSPLLTRIKAGYLTIVCNYAGKVRAEGKDLKGWFPLDPFSND